MTTLADYDPWSQSVLLALQAGSLDSTHTFEYILSHDVRIVIVDNNANNLWWKPQLTWKGLQIQNTLYVSRYIANRPAGDAWVLMEFVHEAHHLEQGFWTAFSAFGEFDAWQVGFRFYMTRPDHVPQGLFIPELLALPLSYEKNIVRRARDLINLYENGGISFWQQLWAVIKGEKTFQDFYWIHAYPLMPLF